MKLITFNQLVSSLETTKEYIDNAVGNISAGSNNDSHLFVTLAYEEIEGEAVPVLSSHSSTEIIAAIAEGKNVIIDGTQCTVFEASSGKVVVSLLSSYSDIVEHINSILTIDADKSIKIQSQRVYNADYIDYLEAVINTKADIEHASETTEHGTSSSTKFGHAMASSTTPKAAGTANIGLETAKFSRGDHVHPAQTTITGNAGTATKLQNGRTITIGNTGKTFDGSGNVSWTLSEIGAAASSHGTHLTLGTGSGNAYRGDYGNTAYTHSQSAHAPSTAQKNSDITKAEIEAKLTGTITSHVHTKSSLSKYANAYVWIDSNNRTYVSDRVDFVNGVVDEFGQCASISATSSTSVNNHILYSFGHWIAADIMAGWNLGSKDYSWGTVYAFYGLDTSSDRNLKENINYIRNNEILLMNNMEDEIEEQDSNSFTYSDLYDFVKTDLELATYNYKGKEKNSLGFIAQDLLYNADGTDNKIGQFIVPPVVALTESELEEKKAEFEAAKKREATVEELKELATPKLEYNQTNYISVLAGALKETINQVEELKDIVAQQQELINQLLDNKTS